MTGYDGIWVLVETGPQGWAKPVGLELMTPALELKAHSGHPVTAVVIGSGVTPAAGQAAAHGADRLLVVDHPDYARYATETYAHALTQLILEHRPQVVLLGATPNGRDLAPRVACRLQTGLTADCTGIGWDGDRQLVRWTRPAFSGNMMAEILCPTARPQMGTVRPGVFPRRERPAVGEPERLDALVPLPQGLPLLRVLEEAQAQDTSGHLDEAALILAGGRGLGGPQGFQLLSSLAQKLGGAVGATRAAVEAGWIAHSHQIGQTGLSVGPKVYLACGISGAVQHLAGIGAADLVIAINPDPDAPIFRHADYGIVGEALPILRQLDRLLES